MSEQDSDVRNAKRLGARGSGCSPTLGPASGHARPFDLHVAVLDPDVVTITETVVNTPQLAGLDGRGLACRESRKRVLDLRLNLRMDADSTGSTSARDDLLIECQVTDPPSMGNRTVRLALTGADVAEPLTLLKSVIEERS